MFQASTLKTPSLLSVILVSGILCTITCVPPKIPDGASGKTIITKFGDFNQKTILAGGQALFESFEQPAFLRFGPDQRLYVTTYTGLVYAISLNADHEVVAVESFKPLGDRILTGLAFDPSAAPTELIFYVTSNAKPIYGADDLTGWVSRVEGFGAGATTTNLIVGLPRSAENHMTFDLEFGTDNRLYIAQGGKTNNGAPAPGLFDNRKEHALSAAILVADVLSPDFSGIQDVEVFAPGLRNPYGLCLHSNGYFYTLDQGANKGFGGRPTPDGNIIDVSSGLKDSLEALVPGRYFGHPNPARGQFAFNEDLSDGTPHQPPLKTFSIGSVVTGLVEYVSPDNQQTLQGSLLLTGFVNQNLHYVSLADDGLSVAEEGIIAGGFANPLELTIGPDGTIYILEAGGTLSFGGLGPAKITVLEPIDSSSGPGEPIALFAKSEVCAECHTSLVDEAGNDVSIDAHWRSTMMANAARDPLWQAKVSSEIARHPELKGAIEDQCALCHMPMASTQALVEGSLGRILGEGFLDPENALNPLAMDGVSCTLCHQIRDIALGEQASFSGSYQIDSTTAPPNRLIYGPFFNPLQELMSSTSGFTPVRGPQITDAGLCATCHTLYTSAVDGEGNVVGQFPEQTPYLEWEHSAFGDVFGQNQTCQDCHMPKADGAVVISKLPENLLGRSSFGQHHFVGGNAFMLKIFKAQSEALGLIASEAELDATLARTLNQLQNNTANLSFSSAQIADQTLTVDVKVDNKAGHKFPTGYPARQAWIHLTVADANDKVVFESGAPGIDGSLAGDDATGDILAFEPHYNLITDPDQVQIYQAIMGNSDGQVTYTTLRALTYLKDNRLLPSGFDKQTARADIAVHGTAADDTNFVGGSDHITYQIDASGYAEPFTVRAELLYSTVSSAFITDLRQEQTELVDRFINLYDSADRQPTTIARSEVQIP